MTMMATIHSPHRQAIRLMLGMRVSLCYRMAQTQVNQSGILVVSQPGAGASPPEESPVDSSFQAIFTEAVPACILLAAISRTAS